MEQDMFECEVNLQSFKALKEAVEDALGRELHRYLGFFKSDKYGNEHKFLLFKVFENKTDPYPFWGIKIE
jgi:hypothetical protein